VSGADDTAVDRPPPPPRAARPDAPPHQQPQQQQALLRSLTSQLARSRTAAELRSRLESAPPGALNATHAAAALGACARLLGGGAAGRHGQRPRARRRGEDSDNEEEEAADEDQEDDDAPEAAIEGEHEGRREARRVADDFFMRLRVAPLAARPTCKDGQTGVLRYGVAVAFPAPCSSSLASAVLPSSYPSTITAVSLRDAASILWSAGALLGGDRRSADDGLGQGRARALRGSGARVAATASALLEAAAAAATESGEEDAGRTSGSVALALSGAARLRLPLPACAPGGGGGVGGGSTGGGGPGAEAGALLLGRLLRSPEEWPARQAAQVLVALAQLLPRWQREHAHLMRLQRRRRQSSPSPLSQGSQGSGGAGGGAAASAAAAAAAAAEPSPHHHDTPLALPAGWLGAALCATLPLLAEHAEEQAPPLDLASLLSAAAALAPFGADAADGRPPSGSGGRPRGSNPGRGRGARSSFGGGVPDHWACAWLSAAERTLPDASSAQLTRTFGALARCGALEAWPGPPRDGDGDGDGDGDSDDEARKEGEGDGDGGDERVPPSALAALPPARLGRLLRRRQRRWMRAAYGQLYYTADQFSPRQLGALLSRGGGLARLPAGSAGRHSHHPPWPLAERLAAYAVAGAAAALTRQPAGGGPVSKAAAREAMGGAGLALGGLAQIYDRKRRVGRRRERRRPAASAEERLSAAAAATAAEGAASAKGRGPGGGGGSGRGADRGAWLGAAPPPPPPPDARLLPVAREAVLRPAVEVLLLAPSSTPRAAGGAGETTAKPAEGEGGDGEDGEDGDGEDPAALVELLAGLAALKALGDDDEESEGQDEQDEDDGEARGAARAGHSGGSGEARRQSHAPAAATPSSSDSALAASVLALLERNASRLSPRALAAALDALVGLGLLEAPLRPDTARSAWARRVLRASALRLRACRDAPAVAAVAASVARLCRRGEQGAGARGFHPGRSWTLRTLLPAVALVAPRLQAGSAGSAGSAAAAAGAAGAADGPQLLTRALATLLPPLVSAGDAEGASTPLFNRERLVAHLRAACDADAGRPGGGKSLAGRRSQQQQQQERKRRRAQGDLAAVEAALAAIFRRGPSAHAPGKRGAEG